MRQAAQLTCLDKVRNSTGRLDVLAFGILKRMMESQRNPAYTFMFDSYANRLARQLRQSLGPPRGRRKRRR